MKRLFYVWIWIVLGAAACTERIDLEQDVVLEFDILYFSKNGETKDVKAAPCDHSLSVMEQPEWVVITKTGDTGEQVFHLAVEKNESTSLRSGNVVIGYKDKHWLHTLTSMDILTISQYGQ
ncbi:MAG: hypothetical protein LBT76_02440 [Tannerella sp.]|jgi:hypothetical protein|nr:hypothetical protein [Tannerella sp.]